MLKINAKHPINIQWEYWLVTPVRAMRICILSGNEEGQHLNRLPKDIEWCWWLTRILLFPKAPSTVELFVLQTPCVCQGNYLDVHSGRPASALLIRCLIKSCIRILRWALGSGILELRCFTQQPWTKLSQFCIQLSTDWQFVLPCNVPSHPCFKT